MTEKKGRANKANWLAPLESLSKEPEDYANYGSMVIQYGIGMATLKGGKLLEAPIDAIYPDDSGGITAQLSLQQVQYINMRAAGLTSKEACTAIGIEQAAPLFWEQASGADSVYMHCMNCIKMLEANQAEEQLWRRGINYPNANLDAFFALKGRKPEYRDNFAMNNMTQVNVVLKVEGRDFVVDTNTEETRVISGEDREK